VPAALAEVPETPPLYQVGAGDSLTIFVWRNAELTTTVTVRPDGRVSVPLIEDLYVEGKNPSDLAREIEAELAVYIQDPLVTVIVGGFVGTFPQQVRIVGEASQPQAIPYRANMTLLDVIIQTGGLTEFADGNNTTLVRTQDGAQNEYRVRLDDLLDDGDISANVALLPGDILIVPETFF
jgi:polysaccharide export outer membrane protein